MQVTENLRSRSVWLFNAGLLNRDGLAWGPILSAFKDRYKFLKPPSSPAELDPTKGIKFSLGEFPFEGNKLSVEWSLYDDGWYAETYVSTDASDAFLEDVVEWVTSDFKFRNPREFLTRVMYDSQLVFISDIDLTKSWEKVKTFTNLVRANGNSTEEICALVFGSDPSSKNPSMPAFTFERRVSVPYGEKTYFSKAAFPTSTHIELLKKLEQIFR